MANPEPYEPGAPLLVPRPLYESDQKELAAILLGIYGRIRSTEGYQTVPASPSLPDDLSPEIKLYFASLDAHSDGQPARCLLANDLLRFGWESRTMLCRAYVDPRVTHLFPRGQVGFPLASWPAEIPISYSEWSRNGVCVEWSETYASIVRGFVREVLPALAAHGSPTRLLVTASW